MMVPSGNQCGLSGLASLSRNVPMPGKPGLSSGKSRFWHEFHPGASVSTRYMQSARR